MWKFRDIREKPSLQIEFNESTKGNPSLNNTIFLGSIQKELSNVKVHAMKGTYTGKDNENNIESGILNGVLIERMFDENNKYSFSGTMMPKNEVYGYTIGFSLKNMQYERPEVITTGTVISAKFDPPKITGQWDRNYSNFKGIWESEIIKWGL